MPLIYYRELKGEVDVIIDEYTTAPFMTPLYVKEEKKVLLVHLLAGERIRYEIPSSIKWLSPFFQRMESKILRVYKDTCIIAVSESTAKELKAIGLRNVHIVEPGIDIEKYKYSNKDEEPLLLYFGRIVPYKGVEDTIMTFNLVLKKVSNIRGVIAGKCVNSEYANYIKGLIKKFGLEKKLQVKFNISEEEKVALLEKAWILILPSLKEGFNIVCLEALASGTPVIGYNVPGIRDVIINERIGTLVSRGDIKGLSRAILNLLEKEEMLEEMRRVCREYATKFTWRRSAEKFRNILLSTNE